MILMYLRLFMQGRIGSQFQRTGFRQVAAGNNSGYPTGFTLFPNFLDTREQCILLASALGQLDSFESKRVRKLQKHRRSLNPPSGDASVESLFLPEKLYTFQAVRQLMLTK